MAEAGFPLLLLAFGALAAAGIWWSWAQAKKRRELFQQFALGQGWRWTASDNRWCGRFRGTPFGEGDHRQARNVLEGTYRGRPMVAFDYSFQTENSDSKGNRNKTTHRYAICSLGLPAPLPELEIEPQGWLGRVGAMLGMQDIELESEDFNRRFRVRCRNPKLAYDVLTPRTMEGLLSRPALHIRLAGADALCWESGQHSPSELLARLYSLSTLVDGVPGYVWSDRKGFAP